MMATCTLVFCFSAVFSFRFFHRVSIVTSRSVQAPVYLVPVRFVAPDSTTICARSAAPTFCSGSRYTARTIFVGRFLSVRLSMDLWEGYVPNFAFVSLVTLCGLLQKVWLFVLVHRVRYDAGGNDLVNDV